MSISPPRPDHDGSGHEGPGHDNSGHDNFGHDGPAPCRDARPDFCRGLPDAASSVAAPPGAALSDAEAGGAPAGVAEELRRVCREGWRQGLFSGCNGNASRLLPPPRQGLVCLTRSGAAKGRLTPRDCCLVDAITGRLLAGGPASTEAGMHLAVYRARPGCAAVLHTHPRRLLALSLRLGGREEDFLRLPLFEAGVWRARLAFAPALPPGSDELALAVAEAARRRPAVWMAGHGLCCAGADLDEALCLAEELEHLAAVQLLAMGAGGALPPPAAPSSPHA